MSLILNILLYTKIPQFFYSGSLLLFFIFHNYRFRMIYTYRHLLNKIDDFYLFHKLFVFSFKKFLFKKIELDQIWKIFI